MNRWDDVRGRMEPRNTHRFLDRITQRKKIEMY